MAPAKKIISANGMNPVNTNLFLVNTEYHLMVSAAIILEHFADRTLFCNLIAYNKNGKRAFNPPAVNPLPAEFKPLLLDSGSVQKSLNELVLLNPARFFFFQENSPVNIALAYKLSRKGCTVCLGQDGAKPYGIYRKNHELLSTVKDSFKAYKSLYRAGIFLPPFYPFEYYKYGSTPFVDELWLSHPQSVQNRYRKILRDIPNPADPQFLEPLTTLFGVQDPFNGVSEKVVLYINQPIKNSGFVEKEVGFLRELAERLDSANLIAIKMHPLTAETTVNRYRSIPGVLVFTENTPAELLIARLKNSIIISGWSTALLTYNPACSFYYILPVLGEDKLTSQIQPGNPTDHIQVVSKPSEIDFPTHN